MWTNQHTRLAPLYPFIKYLRLCGENLRTLSLKSCCDFWGDEVRSNPYTNSTKITVTFEPIMKFWWSSRFKIYNKKCSLFYYPKLQLLSYFSMLLGSVNQKTCVPGHLNNRIFSICWFECIYGFFLPFMPEKNVSITKTVRQIGEKLLLVWFSPSPVNFDICKPSELLPSFF